MIRSLDPFQGLRVSGLLINTQKWIVQGDTRADKPRDFLGKGCLGVEQEGKGTQENCLTVWLRFYGDRMSFQIVSGQSF